MKYHINLAAKRQFRFFDKVLYFFLNYLRYILVITQLVVIGVLFFRFKVDQSIIDLKESIDQKKEIVKAVNPILAETERINKRAANIEETIRNQEKISSSLSFVLSQFPQTITLKRFALDEDTLTLNGTAENSRHLQLFHQRLKESNKFSSVELKDVRREGLSYVFSLSLKEFKN